MMTNPPDTRDEDVLAVAKAFRQVLKDNFAGDFPKVVETLQWATAMAIWDLKDADKITDAGIEKFFYIYAPALKTMYEELAKTAPKNEKKIIT